MIGLPILAVFTAPCSPQEQNSHLETDSVSGRSYYNELYQTGGLDNFSDSYACFPNEPMPMFFIIAKSDALRDFLLVDGKGKGLSIKQKKDLQKGFLIRRVYRSGVANGREYLDPEPSGSGYFADFDTKPVMRLRLAINWQTLRYRITVEEYATKRQATEQLGKCEVIPPDVRQHGSEESNK